MPFYLPWQQVALRIALALAASFLIGLNRDEHGKSAGLRTTMLVCLAATLAQLQANLLLPTIGKAANSFVVLDLERLPLGILSGIGFIGAGAILHKGRLVTGLTTAATLWVVTVLGLLFGGGQVALGSAGSLLVLAILWLLKLAERRLPGERSATLWLSLSPGSAVDEAALRSHIASATCRIVGWRSEFGPQGQLRSAHCALRLMTREKAPPTPAFVHRLAELPEIDRLKWSI